jgi:hypothetical protein
MKTHKVKLNELLEIDGKLYMFILPSTTAQTYMVNENGTILLTLFELIGGDE